MTQWRRKNVAGLSCRTGHFYKCILVHLHLPLLHFEKIRCTLYQLGPNRTWCYILYVPLIKKNIFYYLKYSRERCVKTSWDSYSCDALIVDVLQRRVVMRWWYLEINILCFNALKLIVYCVFFILLLCVDNSKIDDLRVRHHICKSAFYRSRLVSSSHPISIKGSGCV